MLAAALPTDKAITVADTGTAVHITVGMTVTITQAAAIMFMTGQASANGRTETNAGIGMSVAITRGTTGMIAPVAENGATTTAAIGMGTETGGTIAKTDMNEGGIATIDGPHAVHKLPSARKCCIESKLRREGLDHS